MAVTLSRQALASNCASVEDCLRACGAQLWPEGALRQYQLEREGKALSAYLAGLRAGLTSRATLSRALVVAAIFAWIGFDASLSEAGAVVRWYLCAEFLFHLTRWPAWQTNDLLEGDLYWQDGVKRALPAPAQDVVDAARSLFAQAQFAVSFVGHDPVLHVFLDGRSYAALVWDVNGDGTVATIPPPSR